MTEIFVLFLVLACASWNIAKLLENVVTDQFCTMFVNTVCEF